MVFRRFSTLCLIRLLLLTLTLGLAAHYFHARSWSMLALLSLLAVWQFFALLHYINKTNRDLARFIEAIRYGDGSLSMKDDKIGASFSALQGVFAGVFETLRKTRMEKEEHFQYLQTVVQHVGMGLIVFQPDGRVELINNAAKQLFKIPRLRNIAELKEKSPELVETLFRLPAREKGFVKVEDAADALYLALYATEFKMHGRFHRLVSLQNIHRELEEKEMEAWQKLIRVLTHEIMNSVTPISSLASTIHDLMINGRTSMSEEEWQDDISLAARTIEKRSQGLLHFVDSFRSLTLVPKPRLQFFPIAELFARVEKLMSIHFKTEKIQYSHAIEPASLQMEADPDLIEQVLINLLMNSVQALRGRPEGIIKLQASLNHRGRVVLQVTDNGPGVTPENLEKIFVPFFSTKEGGSGIGLSLSRQIMRLHHGAIHVQSEPDVKTVMYLTF